ncbi:MAG: hypothetical protein HOQ05_05895 [Corynebacteriales bacterium]|nr:hypothetical protein [Mycobacteriales bacterium]
MSGVTAALPVQNPEYKPGHNPTQPSIPTPRLGAQSLPDTLRALRRRLNAVNFPRAAREEAKAVIAELDNYLVPQSGASDTPLLTVIGGPTGAGKSALVNTLASKVVTAVGVRRPTTTTAQLVANPETLRAVEDDRRWPTLPRCSEPDNSDPQALYLNESASLPPGLALIDSPDLNSVVDANRVLAEQLISAADLWVFATSAARYADAVPWKALIQAKKRGTMLALVLNRVPVDAQHAVRIDLEELLASHGLADVPVCTVLEGDCADGQLTDDHVSGWFFSLVEERAAAARRKAFDAALDALWPSVASIADDLTHSTAAARELRASARSCHTAAIARLAGELDSGEALRGAVVTCWQEFVAAGDVMRALSSRPSPWTGWIAAASTRRAEALRAALTSAIVAQLLQVAARAGQETTKQWRTSVTGAELLGAGLDRPGAGLRSRITDSVDTWQNDVVELVRAAGGRRRTQTQLEGTALLVSILVFGGFRLGASAQDVPAFSTPLWAAITSDITLRKLAETARAKLSSRIITVIESEQGRFMSALDELELDPELAARLRAAAMSVAAARRGEHI